jgi:hypothetical protein
MHNHTRPNITIQAAVDAIYTISFNRIFCSNATRAIRSLETDTRHRGMSGKVRTLITDRPMLGAIPNLQ